MLVSTVSCSSPSYVSPWPTSARVQFELSSDVYSPEEITERILATPGPIDIYFWYEGPKCLPKAGMLFMEKHFLEPLLKKQDATLSCYSLSAWDFTKDIRTMITSTPIGQVINQTHNAAMKCIYSSSFFQYCLEAARQRSLYTYIQETLPQKERLKALSAKYESANKNVSDFLMGQPSLLDCLGKEDCSLAYSQMQYLEGYYLIHKAVEKRLATSETTIQVAFVLPNDESKYYAELSQEIQELLWRDFGRALRGREIKISFYCFQFKTPASRPYLGGYPAGPDQLRERLAALFNRLVPRQIEQVVKRPMSALKPLSIPYPCAASSAWPPRDVLHGLNEGLVIINNRIQWRG